MFTILNKKTSSKQCQLLRHAPWQEGVKVKKGQRSFWLLGTAFAVTVTVLILVFILLWTQIPRSSASAPAASNVCNSEACISASALLQRSIDLSADPCQDFYSFACGGFHRRSPYSPTTIDEGLGAARKESSKLRGKMFELFYKPELARSEDPEMNSMYQAVREMFLSCIAWHDPSRWWLPHKPNSLWSPTPPMQKFDLKVLRDPIISLINQQSDLEEFLAMLVRTKTSGLIQLSHVAFGPVTVDMDEHSVPVLDFNAMRFELKNDWNGTIADDVSKFCLEVGMNLTVDTDKLDEALNALMNATARDFFFGNITELQLKSNRHLTGSSSFNWTRFLRILNDGLLNPDIPIFISMFPDFMRILNLLAPEHSARRGPLYDLIRVDAAMSLRNFLPMEKFAALNSLYTENKFLISKNEGSREFTVFSRFCIDMTTAAMKPVVFHMFKHAYLTDDFALIHSLITDIEDAMKLNVDEESWIGIQSKQAIKRKISNMHRVVSYHELSTSEMKSVFKYPMERLRQAKTFGDVVLVDREANFRFHWYHQVSGTPLYAALNSIENPFDVNAFYARGINSINILTGIIGTFLYSKDYPEYLLYGGIGDVIAHEIAHALGPSSAQSSWYDQNGTRWGKLFDNETYGTYLQKNHCLVRSYTQLKNSTGMASRDTSNEDFADIVGLNAAFRAYKRRLARSGKQLQILPGPLASRLTPDQLFFVQAAQFYCKKMEDKLLKQKSEKASHSQSMSRIVGTMSQSKDFARIYQCKLGDKMYIREADKCHIW